VNNREKKFPRRQAQQKMDARSGRIGQNPTSTQRRSRLSATMTSSKVNARERRIGKVILNAENHNTPSALPMGLAENYNRSP